MADDIWLEKKELVWIPVIMLLVGVPLVFTWLNSPALVFQAEASLSTVQTSDVTGNFFSTVSAEETSEMEDPDLKLRKQDISYLNRLYTETSHEVAYCGILQDGNVLRVWKTDTINSTRTGIWYDSGNCPKVFQLSDKIRVHTQPSSLDMSTTDKENHIRHNLKYSCIQAGVLSDTDGEELARFACYEMMNDVSEDNAEDAEFNRLSVDVEEVA